MKKFVFLSSLAVVAAVACTKTEFTPVANKEAQIVFNSPIVQLNSKAGHFGEQPETSGKYSTDESFKVFATWTSGDYAAADWGTTLYMDGVEVKYNSSLGSSDPARGAWEPSTAYYWPKNGKLTFAGYSPASLANEAATPSSPTVSYGADGLKVTGFEVDPAPAKQFDFMYAERSYNRTSSSNKSTAGTGHTSQSYDGVDLMFHHALSSIKFKVNSDGSVENTEFTLKKIEILNAQYKGDFKENIVDDATYSSTPAWANDEATVDYSVWSGSEKVENTGYAEPAGISDVILLPQAFKRSSADKNVKVVITYDVTTNGVTLSAQKAEFDLANGYEDTSNNKITAWEMGKRYTYRVYFTLNKIYFSPEVNNWVDVDMKEFDVL